MTQLREVVRRKFNDFRTMDRILTSQEFEDCFALQDDGLLKAINLGDVEFVRDWLRRTGRDLSEYSLVELRKIAADLSIANYTLQSKYELLVKITVRRNELKQTKNPVVSVPYQQ